MKKKIKILMIIWLLIAVPLVALADPVSMGVFEVSYITNSVDDTITLSGYVPSEALFVGELGPGEYILEIVEGRLTGNMVDPNVFNSSYRDIDDYWEVIQTHDPNYEKYESGFNGGNTHPASSDAPGIYSQQWNLGIYYWLGESLDDPNGIEGGHGGWIGREKILTLETTQSLWFFWKDYWNQDNVGGTTIELWHETETPAVPEPTTMLLFGTGIAGLVGSRLRKKKK